MTSRAALLALVLAAHAATGCAQPAPPARLDPPAPASLLQALREGRVPKGTTVLHGPDGRPAYLLTAPCCDQFNPLYDADGRYLCAPTGGFTGRGDGRCPAWVAEALATARSLPPAGPAASAATAS